MMLTMDAGLALVLIALLPVIVLIVWFVTKTSIPLYTKQQGVLDQVVRVVQENITGIRVIKALSKTAYEKARFHEVNEDLTRVDQKAGSVTAITNPAASLVLNIGLTLVVLVGAYRVNQGASDPEVIVAFLQYFVMILNAMLGVTRIFVMWSKAEASARRIAQVLELPEDLRVEKGSAAEKNAPHIEFRNVMWSKGEASAKRVADVLELGEDLTPLPSQAPEANAPHIEFRNVSFSYTGIGKNIDDLSFHLEKGQTLGILGATGSGKSTILNLLMGIYYPDEGEILIDGHNIRTIPRKRLRSLFGVVFQNDFVTEGTIAENIRFFRDLSDGDLRRAAEDAQAASFIAEKEGHMEAEVAVRGNNLSGGQKQRLLIARALAAKPDILVLDDASSALDYATDAKLRHALNRGYGDTTTVLVAQRVSSLRHADLILVLSDGQVIGSGNHEELMESCEEYRVIAQTQMGTGEEVF